MIETDLWENFMRNVMSLTCDMDILGAIGGGIAEELFGILEFEVNAILNKYLEPYLYEIATN